MDTRPGKANGSGWPVLKLEFAQQISIFTHEYYRIANCAMTDDRKRLRAPWDLGVRVRVSELLSFSK